MLKKESSPSVRHRINVFCVPDIQNTYAHRFLLHMLVRPDTKPVALSAHVLETLPNMWIDKEW